MCPAPRWYRVFRVGDTTCGGVGVCVHYAVSHETRGYQGFWPFRYSERVLSQAHSGGPCNRGPGSLTHMGSRR